MATRRQAREWIVQILFQIDLNPDELDKVFRQFWSDRKADGKSRRFVEETIRGIRANQETIDATISRYAENWHIRRMAVTDRNVLRLGVYEMLFCADIPPVVSINEAVDIAKHFNSKGSGKFVNGLLDRIRKEIGTNPPQAAGGASDGRKA